MTDEFGFNDGDILIVRNWMLIYAGCKESVLLGRVDHAITFYALLNTRNGSIEICPNGPRPGIGYIESNPTPTYATNAEIAHFFERVEKEKQVRWNSENKKFEPIEVYEYVC